MPQSQQQRRDRQAREQKPQEQEPQRLGWSRFPREQGLAQQWHPLGQCQQQQRRDRQAREQKPQEQEPQRLGWFGGPRVPREQGLAQWDQQGQRQGLPPILQWSSGEGLVLVVGEELHGPRSHC